MDFVRERSHDLTSETALAARGGRARAPATTTPAMPRDLHHRPESVTHLNLNRTTPTPLKPRLQQLPLLATGGPNRGTFGFDVERRKRAVFKDLPTRCLKDVIAPGSALVQAFELVVHTVNPHLHPA